MLTCFNTIYWQDEDLTIVHSGECPLPGYFIVSLNTPKTILSELPEPLYQHLMRRVQDCYRISQTVIQPEKIYVTLFAEVQPIIHFHVFPRTTALTQAYRRVLHLPVDMLINGPQLMQFAKEHYRPSWSKGEQEHFHQTFKSLFLKLPMASHRE